MTILGRQLIITDLTNALNQSHLVDNEKRHSHLDEVSFDFESTPELKINPAESLKPVFNDDEKGRYYYQYK